MHFAWWFLCFVAGDNLVIGHDGILLFCAPVPTRRPLRRLLRCRTARHFARGQRTAPASAAVGRLACRRCVLDSVESCDVCNVGIIRVVARSEMCWTWDLFCFNSFLRVGFSGRPLRQRPRRWTARHGARGRRDATPSFAVGRPAGWFRVRAEHR